MTVTIEANRTRSTGLRVDAVSDFFRHRGPIWADGEEAEGEEWNPITL